MWETSRGRLSPEALQGVLESAAQSLGVPLVPEEQALIKEISGELDRLLGKVREMDDLIR